MDEIYTPTKVAEAMVADAQCDASNPIVADFAVGGGELLRAAVARWPRARIFGSDIRGEVVAQLSRSNPVWRISKCDFLNPLSQSHVSALRNLKKKVDVVLLNPPFSNRGARTWTVQLKHNKFCCSQGLAFVVASIPYLKGGGQIIAVLPAGTLRSAMDANAWNLISQFCKFEVLARNGHNIFRGFSPKTIIIRLCLRDKPIAPAAEKKPRRTKTLPIVVSVERGKVDMSSLNGNHYRKTVPLIHTTELKRNHADLTKRRTTVAKATLADHAVLLPRVGRPNKSKLCLHTNKLPVALSTCVIAIKCDNSNDAEIVHRDLLSKWKALERTYAGTCASYVTISHVQKLLSRFGFQIQNGHPNGNSRKKHRKLVEALTGTRTSRKGKTN